ncbi:putative outer membrane autotransporter barrel [Synechococcus sp. BIOS-U3-1]|uniref:autotransporter domain-containing protein n=1 Tax=Synechococcus sp. BIOS-U3-1 TaxID=1400865 RepID=UPI0016493464|nr:autotransporter domain-containing protein [Synechococcus sp. BIOS-U3-1]QNI57775.1 putative outer membrane autotransporter barrel [Synechococcus sp. BIOS-U3-1]
MLAALLFCAFAADSSKAFAQDKKPINFPEGQEVPLPGPDTGTDTVTLWQLPDEYKAILETDSGELYGIYYSAWSNPKDNNPGVSATQWVEDANDTNVPWAGIDNADLAQELSIKYFEQNGSLMESACDQNANGSNTSCVDGVQNLYLYGYWNGGGFASWTGDQSAQARPNNDGKNKYQINYYWNGKLFTTPKTGDDLRIQAFAGCKLSEQGTISSGKTVPSSALAPEQDCERGVASVFEGGTLEAVEQAVDLDENFAVRYGLSDQDTDIGGTIDNNGLNLMFTGRFDSVGDGADGKLTFTGSGSSTIKNQAALRGDLVIEEGSLTMTTPSSLFGQIASDSPGVGNLRLIPTPLRFEDGNNSITVKSGSFLRVAGDDLQNGFGPRTPGNSDEPINGDGNRRSPVISLGDGDDILNIDEGGLLVASYVGMLPSEYELYKNNCKEGSDPSTCYRAIPQIDFGKGADTIINNGVIAGPGESPTGNSLEIHLRGGNDKVINNGYVGCLTGGADEGGWNGFKGENTCEGASSLAAGQLESSKDLNRNYNVSFQFEGGDDVYENYGYQRGAVNMGGGNDELISIGGIRGAITMGAGNDILKIEANDSWNGSGIVDDWINLGNSRLTDSSSTSDTNQLRLIGDAVISFRNSLGFSSDQCGTKSGSSGGYGCRWGDNGSGDYGYNYLAVSGSQGRDQIVVSTDSVAGTSSTLKTNQGAQIWGSVDLGGSNDSLFLESGTHLDLVGDLDMGSGDSQSITIGEDADLSVRAIKGSNVDLSITGTATLGGDPVLGVFDSETPAALKKGNTLSTYKGTTSINEAGTLRTGQAWSLSSQSIHQVDGTLKLGDNTAREDQEIGELTGSGLVVLDNNSHLYYGGLDGDVQFSGTSEGNGSLVKAGSGTTTFSGEFSHTGFTKVHGGTLLISAGGVLNPSSTVILGGQAGTLDLAGTTQSVDKIKLWNGKQGTLKNGFLNTGSVEVQGAGFIESVGAVVEKSLSSDGVDVNQGSASLVVVGLADDGREYGGYLTMSGDNHFKDLALTKGKVLLDSGSLVLDAGVTGSADTDALVLQGALTLNEDQTIDLGSGNDLFLIGEQGSLIAAPSEEAESEVDSKQVEKLKITIDGGPGDLDIFWDGSGNYYGLTESADGLFTENEESQLAGNVQNFELVGVAGQGIAYFGTKPSFVTVQTEAFPPAADYGLMLGSVGKDKSQIGIDQKLTINNNYESVSFDSLITTVGGIALGKGKATILVPGGTLEAGIIYGQGDSSKNTIELGSVFTDEVITGALSSVAQGRLDVGVLYGYDTIDQLGGLWSYNGRMDDTTLNAQGFVRVQSDDSVVLKGITTLGRSSDIDTPFGVQGRSVIAVSGELTIGEKGIQELGDARASLLVALGEGNGDGAHVDLIGESNYSGPTIVARGGSLHAHTDGAMSSVSKTLVGKDGSILIEGEQVVNRLMIRKDGQFIGGGDSKLTTQSIVNRGDISLDSLVIEDGMTRFIDRFINYKASKGEVVSPNSPLRKIDAQGSLKNIGGSISVNGDLRFTSTGDAGGHALLNLSTGGLRAKDISPASISANSIQFSEKNDVLINSGFVQTNGIGGIDFGGGNDLVLSKGTFSIESGSKIDGGEPLDTSNWKPGNRSITGLNIFKAYEDPGVDESDLVNWAAIKLGSDQDWLFPQGGECRVTGAGNIYSKDTLCVGLTGEKKDQFVRIDSGATLDAGVIALGRGSSNTIEVRNGKLHAILIEGSPGQTKGVTNDRLFLGNDEGGSGELIVGAITGFETMEQRGGTWSYAVNGVDDPQVKDRLIKSGRRSAEELDEMGSFPAFTGYGIAKIAPVEITGRNKKQKTVQRASFARIEGTNPDLPLQVQNIDSELEVAEGIFGNASLITSGNTLLNGESQYTGPTTIQSGGELKAGNSLALSPSSEITIEPGGVLDLDGYANTIPGLYGGSRLVADPGIIMLGTNCSAVEEDSCDTLSGGSLTVSKGDFAGTIEEVQGSQGAVIKIGSTKEDLLILSGLNQYFSPTFLYGGVLRAGADGSLSPHSRHVLLGGELDLRGYQQVLPELNISGGVLRVESNNPLNVTGSMTFADGQILAYLNNGKDASAPINLTGSGSTSIFKYETGVERSDSDHGIYAVVDPASTSDSNLNGTWKVISGEIKNIEALASKTFLVFPVADGEPIDPDQVVIEDADGQLYTVANFAGINVPLDAASLKTVLLEEGSLNIVVKDKPKQEVVSDIENGSGDRFGCDGIQDLCESFNESVTTSIVDAVLSDVDSSGIDQELPLMHWGHLASLLGSGLSPRNVDAAPRGLQTYNNVLADTVFDRHPLRQFEPLIEAEESATDSSEKIQPQVVEPFRGLWQKQGPINDSDALEYLSNAVADNSADRSADHSGDDSLDQWHVISVDGLRFKEDQSLTAQYADRDGWRAWYRGFAANSRAYNSTAINNDYSLYTGGFALGADLSLSDSFQLGAFVNYGDVTAVQRGSTGGGSWSPDGWGGGITADYRMDNFYAQAVFGASGFSAIQNRGTREIVEAWGGDTATAQKSATSYLGALRFGTPFQVGSLLLEPQLTGIWTQNQENGFSESGVEKALRLQYESRTTNYFQTGFGLKTAWPISSGDRAQWVPSIKLAWLADWNVGNEGQSIGYSFSDKKVSFLPKQENQNGALIEVGLDYSVANFNSMSVKVYANGGAEIWAGDRGTNWRASGGLTFQF